MRPHSLVVLALALAAPRAARADDPPFTIGSRPAWYLMGGVTGGDTVVSEGGGGFVGGELSLVRLRDGVWTGLYGDGYYDFGIDGTYVTAGGELGYRWFGFDGGAAF